MGFQFEQGSPLPSATVRRTHDATGISVTFNRLGFEKKTRIAYDHGYRTGTITAHLMNLGEGVAGWEGVTDAKGKPVPYDVQWLDAVDEQTRDKGFGAWFTINLLDATGMGAMLGLRMPDLSGVPAGNASGTNSEPGTPGPDSSATAEAQAQVPTPTPPAS